MPLPEFLDPEGTVLFLGSGFTSGATAISGRSPPVGYGLRDILADMLNVPKEKYDLQSLADAFLKRKDLNLFEVIRNNFTINGLTVDQREILSKKWLRVYTTNYDDAAELGYHQNGISLPSFNYDDERPVRVPRGAIIHLHGTIRKANHENIHDQLILGQKSYIRQHFEKSPWYDEFLKDIRYCDSVFFIGYSLSDPHVTALISNPGETRQKIFFILKGEQDPLLFDHINGYGEVHSIETSGFAKLCRTLPKSVDIADLHRLRALRYVDPFQDQKTLSPPTPIEIINLVAFGTFDTQRCLSVLPSALYIAPRLGACEDAQKYLLRNKTLLIHSRLGNGKSIFTWILSYHLIKLGYVCFRCSANTPVIERELRTLASLKRVVIIFDDYDVAVDVAQRVSEVLPNANFIVTVRTGIQEVRLHEITERLPAPVQSFSINSISASDKEDFVDILENAGALKDGYKSKIRDCSDIREIITSLYKNSAVKKEIKNSLEPIIQDSTFSSVIILGLLLSWIGTSADPSFYIDVCDISHHSVIAKHRETLNDIFMFDDDVVSARSPIFSEYLLQNHFPARKILDTLQKSLIASVQRKHERKYRAILGNLMRFSQLQTLLRNYPDSLDRILDLYNRIQRDIDIREEPLFWLQFTIATIETGRIEVAEGFLETAYEKARAKSSFQTYQIDTQALRLYLLLEIETAPGSSVARLEKILKATDLVTSMIGDQSHRHHAVRVLESYGVFIARRVRDLSLKDRNSILRHIENAIVALGRLPEQAKIDTGAGVIMSIMTEAKRKLLLPSGNSL